MKEAPPEIQGQSAPRLELVARTWARRGGRASLSIGASQAAAFAEVRPRLEAGPFGVDAGCGTGRSSFALAAATPALSTIIGLDRSAARLAKGAAELTDARVRLLRARIEEFFVQLEAAGLQSTQTWLLYPNPYPKPGRISARLYMRPGFDALVRSSRSIEMRTNWEVYAREFAQAISSLGREVEAVEPFDPPAPISDFERKYLARGQRPWRVLV